MKVRKSYQPARLIQSDAQGHGAEVNLSRLRQQVPIQDCRQINLSA